MSLLTTIKALNGRRRRSLVSLFRPRLSEGIRGRRNSCLNIPHPIRVGRLVPRAPRRLRGLILLAALYRFILLLGLPLLFVGKSRLMATDG